MALVRDDARRLIEATGQGTVVSNDLVAALLQVRDWDAWAYGVLLDLRYVNWAPTIGELTPIVAMSSETAGSDRARRGPGAIVVSEAGLYSKACAYAAAARPRGRAAVFRDREEALRWLEEQLEQP